MYKITCDGTTICDPRVEELALINPVIESEENKAGSFSFEMPKNHPYIDKIKRRISVIEVYEDDTLLFCGSCTEYNKDFYNTAKFYCEGELSWLNDSVQRPARYQDISVRGYLETLINNHNSQVEDFKKFTVGAVTVKDNNDSLYRYTNMETTMECLKKDLVDDLGGIIRIRHEGGIRYIDYLADYPNTNKQVIRFGKNLLDLTSSMDSSDIATAIIPLGVNQEAGTEVEGLETRLTIKSVNDGKDYVYSPEAVSNYGWIYKTVTWDDVTTPEALKTKGEKYLSDIQFENMVIEAKAVDMHIVEGSVEMFKVGDRIRVISEPHGLDRYFPLTKQIINLNAREKDSVTLGKSERTSLTAKSNQVNEKIKKAIEEIPSESDILKQAKDNATQLINSATNGNIVLKLNDEGHPEELLIMDTNDIKTSTKVWRWNLNGLGYSGNGYNGTYGTAITMDGKIVADYITTGTMQADRIKGGTLKLGGSGNGNGMAQIVDAKGKVLVTLDNNGITLADGVKIAWKNVSAPDNLATTDDIPSDEYITTITKNMIKTDTLEAQNLKVTGNSTLQVGANNVENNNYIYLVSKTGEIIHEAVLNGGQVACYGTDNYSAELTRVMLNMAYNSERYFRVYKNGEYAQIDTGDCNLACNASEAWFSIVKATEFDFASGGKAYKDDDNNRIAFDTNVHVEGTLSSSSLDTASLACFGNATIGGEAKVQGNFYADNMYVPFEGSYQKLSDVLSQFAKKG